MSFKCFSTLAAIFSAERNHFSNFGTGSSKEHFCRIFLNRAIGLEEMSFKVYFSFFFSSGGHFVQWRERLLQFW